MQNAGNKFSTSEMDHESHKPNFDEDEDDNDFDSDDLDDGDYDENDMNYLHENEEVFLSCSQTFTLILWLG